VFKAFRVFRESLAPKVLLDLKAYKAFRAQQVLKAHKAFKAFKVRQVHKVFKAHKV
jgi:hypothetical protein